MSKLFYASIKTSESHYNTVIITAVRINNDTSGNPRYGVQVWVTRNESGNLWSPKVKGYRLTKDDVYILQSYNLDEDVKHFIMAFEKAVEAL